MSQRIASNGEDDNDPEALGLRSLPLWVFGHIPARWAMSKTKREGKTADVADPTADLLFWRGLLSRSTDATESWADACVLEEFVVTVFAPVSPGAVL